MGWITILLLLAIPSLTEVKVAERFVGTFQPVTFLLPAPLEGNNMLTLSSEHRAQ